MSRKFKDKEGVVLLIDVGQNVGQQVSTGETFLDQSKECASRIIERKLFSDSKDQFSLVLIGSDETDNELDYLHINVKNKWLTRPNFDTLKTIKDLYVTGVENADWLCGLIVAINLLKEESECKQLQDLKIVMISNFATRLNCLEQVDDVIEALKSLKINLVVIGPECDDDDDDSEKASVKSRVQRKGEAVIGRIVNEVDGVMCRFDEALKQLRYFQKVVAKPASWNCDLQIGKNIFIPITGLKKFQPKDKMKWTKKTVDKAEITQEKAHFYGDQEVEKSDVISSYLFGQTVIPISEDDKTSMAMTTEKCLQVIGFTKQKNVPRHIYLGDSAHYVIPRNNVKSASMALAALVKALLELDMVGIVRKVYMKNTAPRIGALIPACEQQSYFFYYVQLPFAEDERLLKLPSLSRVQPSQEQLDAVDELIDSMDLSQYGEDEDPYAQLINPYVEHTNSLIISKALNPYSKLPTDLSDNVKKLLQPEPEILENASNALTNIKNLFKLEELEQTLYRRGAADLFERSSSNVEQADIKPQNLADSLASLVQSRVTEIGTVDPEGNFLLLLENGVPFNKLFEQMKTAIKKLFLTSTNAASAQKPLSALSLLRKHSIVHNPSVYNQLVSELKDEFVERDQSEFWSLIAQDKLGLITSIETEKSSISLAEAEIFYQVKNSESQSEMNYEIEAEDLLDMV